jgi:hypothetical protein
MISENQNWIKDYLLWEMFEVDYACRLNDIIGLEDPDELFLGKPINDIFPDYVTYTMDPDRPYSFILTDTLQNNDCQIVISKPFRDFLRDRELTKVEFLPISIVNHKNRVIKEPYYILHCIDFVDCLDIEKSGAVWSTIDTNLVDQVYQLVLNDNSIDRTRGIFKLKYFHYITLIQRELAEAIDQKKFTGNRWIEIEDYPQNLILR